jgi:diphosphomevalonate decarboxylase
MVVGVARAQANLALAKYWGKRDERLNLPYTGSISITLAGLSATVRLERGARGGGAVVMNGAPAQEPVGRQIAEFLDLFRGAARSSAPVAVTIETTFPVAAGLASSAAIFAAVAVAANAAFELDLPPRQLSLLARRGSGSAARSIYGGYVEWLSGELADGSDSYAVPLAEADHWRLGVVVAITDDGAKAVGSRPGMQHSVRESPFFPAWLATHEADLEAIRRGILARDLAAVGTAAEHNCLKMHAVAMAARPAILYWKPATLAVMQRVRDLRARGVPAYFTIDAGPQVKVLCPLAERAAVAQALAAVPGVRRVVESEPGPAATLVHAAGS